MGNQKKPDATRLSLYASVLSSHPGSDLGEALAAAYQSRAPIGQVTRVRDGRESASYLYVDSGRITSRDDGHSIQLELAERPRPDSLFIREYGGEPTIPRAPQSYRGRVVENCTVSYAEPARRPFAATVTRLEYRAGGSVSLALEATPEELAASGMRGYMDGLRLADPLRLEGLNASARYDGAGIVSRDSYTFTVTIQAADADARRALALWLEPARTRQPGHTRMEARPSGFTVMVGAAE